MRHILIAVTSSLIFATPVFAESCLDPVQAIGRTAALQDKARSLGVLAWKRRVSDIQGAGYANWAYAQDKRVVCFSTVTPKSTLLHQCKVRARPCLKLILHPGLNDQL
jgi:hypothetical protein